MADRIDEFEAYLRGEMNESDQKAFQQDLTDPQLMEEFESYRAVRYSVSTRLQRHSEEQTFLATIQRLNLQYLAKKQVRKGRVRRNWLVAASITFLLFASLVTYQNYQFSDRQLIRAAMTERPLSATRGTEGLFASLPEAMMAYQKNDWPRAAKAFSKADADASYFTEAQLYAGYAFLHAGQYQSAEKAFTQAALSTDLAPIRQNAEWHIALAQVPNTSGGDLPPALETILRQPDHIFFASAKSLQKQLGSIWR